MPTPLRSVRVAEDVWQAAKAAAEANGETVTDVIVRALAAYSAPTGDEMTDISSPAALAQWRAEQWPHLYPTTKRQPKAEARKVEPQPSSASVYVI